MPDPSSSPSSTSAVSEIMDEVRHADPLGKVVRHEIQHYQQDRQDNNKDNASATMILSTAVAAAMAGLVLSSSPSTAPSSIMMMHGIEALKNTATHFIMNGWDSYSAILDRAPIQTKAVTSATVYAIGDILSQVTTTQEGEDNELDIPRVVRSLMAGLIAHGPLSHLYYNLSEEVFTNTLHMTQWWSFVPKIAVDQFIWGPIWTNIYIILLGAMKMDTPQTILSDMKRLTVPLVVSGLKLWPLAHCVTYGLVPVENRLLWVDLVEIAWVTILASQTSAADDSSATIEDETTVSVETSSSSSATLEAAPST
eukprot:CAMPEP_0195285926 /NCGR_PEP_ID=MMETSP0707-20130614/3581_1 /TAXON_ID=33640 /ORGANISM="Asterionellopsis glacialis, Strain CCMP134" /LENGTH=309 /DNA_ID=CAMNT_0040345499 /DNA_START=662 /DNA_END=1591 /DNA_ORIENTATION=+